MNKRPTARFWGFVLLAIMIGLQTKGHAQGLSRSKGVGFRTGFWKTARSEAILRVEDQKVELSGAGGWMYFFSRISPDWFYEFQIGAFASVISNDVVVSNGVLVVENEDVTVIVPFLLGARYDFLSARNQGGLQPYLSFGGGIYWITNVDQPRGSPEIGTVDSGADPGAYLGTGMNIGLSSWFALNFDLKYHFVDLQIAEGFSGIEFGMGLSFMWGEKREILRVLGVRTIVNDVYPAYYQFYNLYPIAMLTVRNMTKHPIEVNVRSNIRYFSERPSDSGYITLAGKETKDIPITAIFGKRLRTVKQQEVAVLDIDVEARAAGKFTKQLSSSVMVHGPNSWNGEMDKLAFFLTPEDDKILAMSRQATAKLDGEQDSGVRNFAMARSLFDELAGLGLHYHSDPNIPFYQDDRVQFARQTLEIGSGDCDDLVVLYASLLESSGINTAFVEVRDPDKDLAHLYLMFNSGVPAGQGHLVSSNEKRFVLRENARGHKTIWIPVETTRIDGGFEQAWKAGALEYLQDGNVRGGVALGWVRIIDIE